MSFILDALKKSENERQRTIGPSLADAPMRRHQADRPWWAIAVAALLIVNLGVLLLVLTRKDDKPAPATAAPSIPTAAAATAAPMARTQPPPPAARAQPTQAAPVVTDPSVRSLAEEADGTYDDPYLASGSEALDAPSHPGLAAAANVPSGPSIVRPIEAPAVAPLPAGAATAARSATQGGSESVPTMNALAATGVSLPDLHLDIHVYSTKPAERFIFVNMRKYHEGDTLTEGPTIERITPEGAVVNQQGQRFLLPRP